MKDSLTKQVRQMMMNGSEVTYQVTGEKIAARLTDYFFAGFGVKP